MKKKTLVIGASTNPERYSNKAIKSLQNKNIETIALGLRKGEVASVIIETDQLLFENVHTITLYLNPKRQEDYYKYIISLNPKRVIFNPGTENLEFYKLLKENNIETEVACTLVLLATNQY
jgi:predicted CoA-binding protein